MKCIRKDIGAGAGFSFPVDEVKNLCAKLDQNECGCDLPTDVKELLVEAIRATPCNRYPQPSDYYRTKEIFAEAVGFSPANIYLTAGCDQVIITSFWLAGGSGRRTLIFDPTYPMFAHTAVITGTEADRVTLGPDFRWDASLFARGYDLLHIVSPNNPTGQLAPVEVVEAALASGALVMVDEAYFDFSGHTYTPLISTHENLLVGRSLAKSGLAHIRLGYGVANEEIVRLVEHLLFVPYHLNALQLATARIYGQIKPYVVESAARVNRQKEKLYVFFQSLGLDFVPSHANFVLFKVNDPDGVYGRLLQNGVRIRNTSRMPGLSGWLRVTVGTDEEMGIFQKALGKAITP